MFLFFPFKLNRVFLCWVRSKNFWQNIWACSTIPFDSGECAPKFKVCVGEQLAYVRFSTVVVSKLFSRQWLRPWHNDLFHLILLSIPTSWKQFLWFHLTTTTMRSKFFTNESNKTTMVNWGMLLPSLQQIWLLMMIIVCH